MPSVEQMTDILNSTFPAVEKNKVHFVAMTKQQYPMFEMILRKRNSETLDGGTVKRTNYVDKLAGTTRQVQIGDADIVTISPVTSYSETPMRHSEYAHGYDVREDAFNSGPAKIYDEVMAREASVIGKFAEHIDDQIVGKPVDSSDQKSVWGTQMWFLTSAIKGHQAGAPAGFPLGPTLSSNNIASALFGNYCAQYSNYTEDSMVSEHREAMDKTKFISPLPSDMGMIANETPDNEVFTHYLAYQAYQRLARIQNTEIGADLAEYDDKVVVRGRSVKWWPRLDNYPTGELLTLGWDYAALRPMFLKGHAFEQTRVKAWDKHMQVNVFNNTSFNLRPGDRRRLWVLKKV